MYLLSKLRFLLLCVCLWCIGLCACLCGGLLRYLATVYFMVVVVFGAMILPTMLIGVVAIKFESASAKFENERKDQKLTNAHLAVLREDESVRRGFSLLLLFIVLQQWFLC